jgi:diguanylate cyclase (GGDEF)-like protein/putative nucleotidyltransferase with HDIG domain
MVTQAGFTRFGNAYLWSVIATGFTVIGLSIHGLYAEPIGNQWFILAALTLISGSATVTLPSSSASISLSETFVFTAVLLYGPAAGTIIVALDGLIISFWISKRRNEKGPHRALFNMSAPAVSAWCGAQLFFRIAGIAPLIKGPSPTYAILPALIVFALVYFCVNSWLITFVIALERRLNPLKVWTSSFLWMSLNYFAGASIAFLFVGYNRRIDIGYIGVIVPLLLVLYFTFKTTISRVEDADRHLEQLNRLYLSTIETLAMAIDAKDQVTHGHIRRVQAHATSLAKEVGVRDEKLLKAIEAAALLHDMGKLAVPEYILNKPGKLTHTEFEKMKLHASVGADILSAIEFPYPVVPIVRHHHENWDGTGYPAGIKATAIPIGARILAVVDCFDALTSDRPYRPKLSDEEALAILWERRGTMYDPMIVDTFFRVHSTTETEIPRQGPPSDVLNTIARSRRAAPTAHTPATPAEVTAGADEMLTVYELARALAGQVGFGDAGDVIGKHLRRLIPAAVCVFYVYDDATDELEARHVVGDASLTIRGLRMGLGQKLSGWVAANRQTILNSDAALDFGEAAQSSSPPLRSCLSTPLVFNEELIGVLSLYSSHLNGFNDDHRRVIEVVARQVAHIVKHATEFDSTSRRDALTGLPNLQQLEQFVDAAGVHNLVQNCAFTLLFIDVVDLKRINAAHGRAVGDQVLVHVVRYATAGLRLADILFRYGSDEFVALLNDTSADSAMLVAERIREGLRANPMTIDGQPLSVEVSVTAVSPPGDGGAFPTLVETARMRAKGLTTSHGAPSGL